MASDDRIGDEKLQYVLTERLQKHHYHQTKLINMNIILVKKYYLLVQVK